ncbi:glyoxylase-like metal-dependent hydrolase (beta-lactamase superfamily II) [Enterococcus sp. PF1-24]|uniref:MBL fold metallo-hydrolase n=1 Tax=unclassified Enterococcus TaxID=2608891 RepID=UPI002476D558|nr:MULTISPECIES: MBL fold metallo-hydrolase [unclassified Enterococcus]MDH6364118.1 glyoxylase-like metal-dependent hydrolase (beta-lactamase superfamily II) [Enterococcus sp. PFB1-1]MDH6401219.1 glyoxylase-like metal-dependent hydrolase (beta-lactamase superfamily II) [Enterococcus sp. PF1-24]
MRIQKYGNLTQITALSVVNCFLYEEEKSLTLIDALHKVSGKKLVKYLLAQNKPVENIIFTHAHSDHLGDVLLLKENFPKATFYLGKRENDVLQSSDYGNLTPPAIEINHFLTENDQVGSLTVLDSPGHTKGSISLYNEAAQQFIVGDLIQNIGRTAVAGDKVWQFPFAAWATWDYQVALESVEKLRKYSTKEIFCGHGQVFTNWP